MVDLLRWSLFELKALIGSAWIKSIEPFKSINDYRFKNKLFYNIGVVLFP